MLSRTSTGASGATTYNLFCVPYTVISSLALLASFLTLSSSLELSSRRRRDRSHLRFIPDKLVNEECESGWQVSRCTNAITYQSKSLHHALLYHSFRALSKKTMVPIQDNERIIAYHATTNDQAVDIAQNGFPVDQRRKVSDHIRFTRIVEKWNTTEASESTAIICARLNLGHVVNVESEDTFKFSAHSNIYPQMLQLLLDGSLKVNFPDEIENWVIALRTRTNEIFDISAYDGCI
ncbi:unnamed protein product [Adineta ricciae]|uniref:Uncharacterized protein n=1 Tax=Adineta ricciae TaxID=249248 RepID=A0A815K7B0_ADIRI|nr:unnamed protein product [Adineta ricciae]